MKTSTNHFQCSSLKSNQIPTLVSNNLQNVIEGKCFLGRIQTGTVRLNDKIKVLNADGTVKEESKVMKLFNRRGLDQMDLNEASAVIFINTNNNHRVISLPLLELQMHM